MTPEECSDRAARLRHQARTAAPPEFRTELLVLADRWERMAGQARWLERPQADLGLESGDRQG